METYKIQIVVDGGSEATSGRYASELMSTIQSVDASVKAERKRSDPNTMDVGTIIQVVIASQAVALLAAGVADWLRLRSTAKITITKDGLVAENVTADQVVKIISMRGVGE